MKRARGKPRARFSCGGSGRSDLADVLRLQPLRPLRDLELHRVALGEAAEALGLDRCEVDEHIRTRLLRDKAEALRVVEPLHLALCHTDRPSLLNGASPRTVKSSQVTATWDGLKQKPRDWMVLAVRRHPVTVPRIA